MSTYQYIGVTHEGKRVQGHRECSSERILKLSLIRLGIQPVEMKKVGERCHGTLNDRELSELSRELAVLLRLGYPLTQALQTLSDSETHPRLKKYCHKMGHGLGEGRNLPSVLREIGVFPENYVEMLAVAYQGASLAEALETLSQYHDQQAQWKRQIIASLIYPGFLALMSLAISFLSIYWLIPQMKDLLSEFGRTLPWQTQLLIDISECLKQYALVLIAALVAVFAVVYQKRKSASRFMQHVLLKIPMAGDFIKMTRAYELTDHLRIFLRNGLTLGDALESIAKSSSALKDSTMKMNKRLSEGYTLYRAMSELEIYPKGLIQKLSFGFENADLETVCEKMAYYYRQEINLAITRVSNALGPILLVSMGLLIGFLMVSIMLPVFQTQIPL